MQCIIPHHPKQEDDDSHPTHHSVCIVADGDVVVEDTIDIVEHKKVPYISCFLLH
jgi:hypothetical protein